MRQESESKKYFLEIRKLHFKNKLNVYGGLYERENLLLVSY